MPSTAIEPGGARPNGATIEAPTEWLLLAAVALSAFTALSYWPHLYSKIQPTELVFVVLLPLAALAFGRSLWPSRLWLLIFGAYNAANFASAIASGEPTSILESFGRGYLIALCLVIAAYVRRKGDGGARSVATAWLVGGLAEAVLSLAGYALALGGYGNTTVKVFPNYPYLGTVFRAAGFTDTPGMLVIVLGFPFLFAWTIEPRPRWRTPALLVLGLAMLLTVSKELALFALGAALLHPRFRRQTTSLKFAAVAVIAVVLWAGSHAVLVFNTSVEHSYLSGMPYTSGRVLARVGNMQVVETTYTSLKRANWRLGLAHPALGVGPGQSDAYLPALKAAGVYPSQLPNYDPHSTWMGAFSETGLLGLATLACMVGGWVRVTRRDRVLSSADPALRAAGMYLLLLLIESVMIDAMNFRSVWIAVAIALGAGLSENTNAGPVEGSGIR